MKKYRKHTQYVFAVVGITIFSFVCYKIGPAVILEHLHEVGWWIVPALIISPIWYLFYVIAWMQFLGRGSGDISIWELYKIKTIGEAINTTTPVNFVGGDPARAYLLKKYYPGAECAASVVVDRTLYSIAILIFILSGLTVAFGELDFLPENIKYILPLILSFIALSLGFILARQHKGLFTFLANLMRKLKIKKEFSSKTLEKLEEVDGHIQDFYKTNKRGFWIAILLHTLAKFLGVFEIFFVGYAIDSNFTFGTAFLLAATAPILNFAFTFIPGAIGVMEGVFTAILYSLGFSPAIGISIQIVRRLRAGLWILIGFIFLGTQKRKQLAEEENLQEINL